MYLSIYCTGIYIYSAKYMNSFKNINIQHQIYIYTVCIYNTIYNIYI